MIIRELIRMSLPVSLASQTLPALHGALIQSPLDSLLQIFNTNPYFIGLTMLILNLGGRFISLEITKKQEQFLQLPWVRRILIFTVLFVATRNIWVAFWATLVVVLFLGYLFNENSSLCLFGNGGVNGATCAEAPKKGEDMTPEEKEILQRLSAKAHKYQNIRQDTNKSIRTTDKEDDDITHTDIYAANLTLLRK